MKSVPAVSGRLVVLVMCSAPSGHMDFRKLFLELYSSRLKSFTTIDCQYYSRCADMQAWFTWKSVSLFFSMKPVMV